jgi:DNA-binding beta-propeller fold protein YncE
VIVGTSEDASGGLSAFLWDARQGMRDLQEILTADLGVDLSGWKLTEATAVSGDGRTIVGNGINPHGDPEAWIAHVDARVTSRPADAPPCRITESACRFGEFENEIASSNGASAVAMDADGSIYVVGEIDEFMRVFDAAGRAAGQWTLRESPSAQGSRPTDICLRDGAIYITDAGLDRVASYDRRGRFLRAWGEPGQAPGQFCLPQGLAVAGAKVYVADTGNHRIQIFDPQGRLLKTFGEYGREQGQLNRPMDVAVATDGSIFVADTDNHRIQKFDAEGRFLLAWGDWGHFRALLSYPAGVTCHAGAVYVADTGNHRIQVFDEQGNARYAWGTPVVVPGQGNGRLHYPRRVGLSPSGDRAAVAEPLADRFQLFGAFADAAATRLDRANLSGAPANPLFGMHLAAGSGLLAVSQPDDHTIQLIGPRSAGPMLMTRLGGYGSRFGQLNDPAGVSFDPAKLQLYVNDRGNQRLAIYEIERQPADQPTQSPTASRLIQSYDYQALTQLVPLLEDKRGMAPESIKCTDDGLYLVDPSHDAVFVFGRDMKFMHALGGSGQLRGPTDVAVNVSSHTAYVVDSGNYRIQAFDAQGKFLFGWGLHGKGPGEFQSPYGIATAADGSVYVTDRASHRVQQFDERGRFLRQWGRRGIGAGELFKPAGIVIDEQQRVLVLDHGNHRIQMFTRDGKCLAVFGGGIYSKPAGPLLRPLSIPRLQPPAATQEATASLASAGTMPSEAPAASRGAALTAISNDRVYEVTCTPRPSPIPLNEPFDLDVRISGHQERKLSVADVTLNVDARMPAHGHGMNTLPRVQKNGDGTFTVTGLLFHMPGHWELYFDVTRGKATQRAQIDVDLE